MRPWRDEAITFAALVAAIAAGAGLFFRAPALLTIAPVAGLVAGLGARRWWSAALVGAAGVIVGFAAASVTSNPPWAPGFPWLADALQTAAVAALLGGLVAWLVHARETLSRVFSAIAVLVICGVMFYSALSLASIPIPVHGTAEMRPSLEQLSGNPAYQPSMSDDDLFLIWVNHLRAGESYYPMEFQSLVDANAARPESPLNIRSPFSYRPPTLYVLLSLLPASGFALLTAMMLACSLGVVCAYLLAREFVPVSLALASAIVLAAMLSGYGTMNLLDAESWAGIAALASVTAFVMARRRPAHERALQLAAVALAVLATALRELMAPLLVLGLIATLTTAETRRSRAWIAWAGGLAVAVAGLAAHWLAAARTFAGYSGRDVAGSWVSANGAGLLGALKYAAVHAWVLPAVCWVLLALGAFGSVIASRDLPTRVVLGGVALGGPLALVFVHPPGETTTGVAPGYWGDMVIPVTWACTSLALTWLASRQAAENTTPAADDAAEATRAA
jgi:hypothetical protein